MLLQQGYRAVTPLIEKHWHDPRLDKTVLKIARASFLLYYAFVIALRSSGSDWLYWSTIYSIAWILTFLSYWERPWHKHLFYIYGGGCFFYAGLLATRLVLDLPQIVPSQYYEVAGLLINVVWFYSLGLELQDRPE